MKKQLAQLKQYWIFLLWIGLFLLVAGGTAGLLTGEWMPTPTLMVIFGTTTLSMWAMGQDRVTRGFWSRRSTEVGTNAIVSTLAIVGILAATNVLAARYSARIDLTESQQFTLAPESVAIAANLDSPVKIWIFSYLPNPDDEVLLDDYRRVSNGQITYEYVDPQAQPGMVQEFGVTADGEVFLEANDNRQFVQTIDLNGISEAQLSNRIAQLNAGDASKIYFLQGHGERSVIDAQKDGMARALKALAEKNFAIEPLNLIGGNAAAKIPPDAAVLAIISPTTELFESELDAIEDYLTAGGRVLLTVDPNTKQNLDALAANWGVELGTGIAIDPERWVQGLGPAAPLVVDYGQHPITQEFGQDFSLFPVVKPLRLTEDEAIVAQPLAFTSNASWEEMDIDQGPDWKLDAPDDQPGPLMLAVAVSKPVEPEATAATTADPEVEADASGDAAADPETDAAIEDRPDTQTEPENEESADEAAEPLDPDAPIAADETNDDAIADATDETSKTEATADATAEINEDEPEIDDEPDATARESRLVIFGDSDFLTDSFFDNQLNGDLFLNAIGWLAEVDEAQLSIRAKESTERSLTLTPPITRLLAWTTLATFPAIGFGASAILWWKRR